MSEEHHQRDDNRHATHHFGVPAGWVRSVDVACTKWLSDRGLLASQQSPLLAAAQKNGVATRRRTGWGFMKLGNKAAA